MPLAAGTRLGPYEIRHAVGAGGMGEVYRARDTKLERDVAIKVLQLVSRLFRPGQASSVPARGMLVRPSGGTQPMWSTDGKELFYKNGNRLMIVGVELGAVFKHSAPQVLFEMPLPERSIGDPSRYAVTPDGRRFLVITTDDGAPPPQPPIGVILNWQMLLRPPSPPLAATP